MFSFDIVPSIDMDDNGDLFLHLDVVDDTGDVSPLPGEHSVVSMLNELRHNLGADADADFLFDVSATLKYVADGFYGLADDIQNSLDGHGDLFD